MTNQDKIAGLVVAVTGASSGIGRETALKLARRGARLVLVARLDGPLQVVADECRLRGAEVAAISADVAETAEINLAVRKALETFGRVDVWVNNAGVLSAGEFLDTPSAVFRRVVETNFFGYVNSARAVLPVFLEQRSGILINNASVLGMVGVAYLTAYVSSKFAIRGFSEALRQEFLDSPVEICTVAPATIDTPIWLHAANFTGRQLKPVPPVFHPAAVADAIIGCIENPKPEVIVGWSGWIMKAGHLMPRSVYDFVARNLAPLALASAGAAHTAGNVLEGMGQKRAAGAIQTSESFIRHVLTKAGLLSSGSDNGESGNPPAG